MFVQIEQQLRKLIVKGSLHLRPKLVQNCIVLLYALWLVLQEKTCATYLTNQMLNQNQSSRDLVIRVFPPLAPVTCLLRVFIGFMCCLRLLCFAIAFVFALVLSLTTRACITLNLKNRLQETFSTLTPFAFKIATGFQMAMGILNPKQKQFWPSGQYFQQKNEVKC